MNKRRRIYILILVAVLTGTMVRPTVAKEGSNTKSGYEDVPQFGGPSSVGANLREDNEVRKPWFRLENIDKATKPWFDWKGRLNKDHGLSFGLDYTALAQAVSDSPGEDGAAGGIFRFFGNWTLIGRDSGNTGSIVYKVENRQRLGTDIAPQNLGFEAGYLGIPGTAFSDYGWGLGAHTVRAGHSFEVGAVRVTPIAVRHDAAEPVGYRLDWPGFSMAVVTDLGQAEAAVRDAVADCELLVLEFNYDVDMLRWGKYPGWLKGRVSSSRGHLSNFQAQQFLRRVAGPRLREVVLIHLSKENNRPDLADEMAKRALADWPRVKVTVAAREEPGELLRIPTSGTVRRTMPTVRAVPRQGTLF